MRRAVVASIAVFLCASASARASQAPSVSLTASLSPERLGAGTTMQIGFQARPAPGQAPAAVTQMRLLLPAGLGISTSELGLETCQPARLRSDGPAACPPDSLMGHGSALNVVSFGPSLVTEPTRILLFSGPLRDGQLELLMVAVGDYPVLANIVFSALVLPAQPPYGGLIDATLPLVPGVPEGPDVALVRFQTTIGPAGITYYETIKGRRIVFNPRGILLPDKCPRGGFPFAVSLTFADGAQASARTAVACPAPRRKAVGRRPGGQGAARHGRGTGASGQENGAPYGLVPPHVLRSRGGSGTVAISVLLTGLQPAGGQFSVKTHRTV